jgi:hypothetical protein
LLPAAETHRKLCELSQAAGRCSVHETTTHRACPHRRAGPRRRRDGTREQGEERVDADDLQAAGDHGPGGPHGFGDHGSPAAAATYLGISRSALQTQLQAGKTLAQIANATSGKSAAGLIAALVADAKQHFGSSVPSDLAQRITELVNGVRPAFGPRGDQYDRGPFGPPPSGGSSA